jgi:hypothetical protein
MQNLVSCGRAMLGSLVLLGSMASVGLCAEVGLNFTAQVNFVGIPGGGSDEVGKTYGVRLEPFSTFSGHLVYESNTPVDSLATENCPDCTISIHKQINGLHVEFPGLTLQADEYIIQVQNNVNVSSLGTADVLSVWYPDPSDPSSTKLSKPLLANGSPVTAGSFRMEFVAPPQALPTSQLPETLDPSMFLPSAGAGVFGDGLPYYYTLDIFFKPASVSPFPHSTSDHDLDGDVDGQDLLIWQREFGQHTGDGDADSNLLVDGNDLQMWRTEYGTVTSDLVAAVAVPEPNGMTLMLVTCLIGMNRR